MKIIFTGGGTAGHINPAMAVAKYIREREPNCEIRFAGAVGGIEERLVPREGFMLYTYQIKGFQRSLSPQGIWTNLKTMTNISAALSKAKRDLKQWKPDVVVSTGGYAGFPMLYGASKLGIKTALLEVDVEPGVALKHMAKMADSIMISFEETKKHIDSSKRVVFTGSPLRGDITNGEAVKTKTFNNEKPMVLSFWGSIGAQYMNEKMCEMLTLCAAEGEFNQIHASGATSFEKMKNILEGNGSLSKHNIKLCEYIYDMGDKLKEADLIICRGGASSVLEVCAVGKPAIIVPSPYVPNNLQEKNARVLEKNGGAVVMLEKEISGKDLFEMAKSILADKGRFLKMAEKSKAMAVTDGVENIYKEIKYIVSTGENSK